MSFKSKKNAFLASVSMLALAGCGAGFKAPCTSCTPSQPVTPTPGCLAEIHNAQKLASMTQAEATALVKAGCGHTDKYIPGNLQLVTTSGAGTEGWAIYVSQTPGLSNEVGYAYVTPYTTAPTGVNPPFNAIVNSARVDIDGVVTTSTGVDHGEVGTFDTTYDTNRKPDGHFVAPLDPLSKVLADAQSWFPALKIDSNYRTFTQSELDQKNLSYQISQGQSGAIASILAGYGVTIDPTAKNYQYTALTGQQVGNFWTEDLTTRAYAAVTHSPNETEAVLGSGFAYYFNGSADGAGKPTGHYKYVGIERDGNLLIKSVKVAAFDWGKSQTALSTSDDFYKLGAAIAKAYGVPMTNNGAAVSLAITDEQAAITPRKSGVTVKANDANLAVLTNLFEAGFAPKAKIGATGFSAKPKFKLEFAA